MINPAQFYEWLKIFKVSFGPASPALDYLGTWNANTNSPTLVSSVGTASTFYIVNVAGTTNLNGTNSWDVGDWVLFNGSVWEKIPLSSAGTNFLLLGGTSKNLNDIFTANPISKIKANSLLYLGQDSKDAAGEAGVLSSAYTSILVNGNGDDTNGNGSYLSALETVEGAMNYVRGRGDNSITKQYMVFMQGIIPDTEVTLLPWVHLFSDGSPWPVSLITLDSSFFTAQNISMRYQNLSFAADCNLELAFSESDVNNGNGYLWFINPTYTKVDSNPSPTISFNTSSPTGAHHFNFINPIFSEQNDGSNVKIFVPIDGSATVFIQGGMYPATIDFSNNSGGAGGVVLTGGSFSGNVLKFNNTPVYIEKSGTLFNPPEITLGSSVRFSYDDVNYLQNITQTGSGNTLQLIQNSFPPNFINGFELGFAGFTTINVSAGSCVDSTNSFIIIDGADGVDIASNGPGGLDIGSPAANSRYSIYKIGRSTASTNNYALMASLSPTGPDFSSDPTYNFFRYLGYWVTNSAAQFDAFQTSGSGNTRIYSVASSDGAFQVLTSSAATSAAPVDCSAVVSPYVTDVAFKYTANPGTTISNGFSLVGTSFAAEFFRWVGSAISIAITNQTPPIPLDSSGKVNYLWDSAPTGTALTLTVAKIIENI